MKTGMNRIVSIIMRRDDMTREEAEELVEEARQAMLEVAEEGSLDEAEEIMMDYLGLEMDYIVDLLL